MKVQMTFVKRAVAALVVLGLSSFIVSCGGKKDESNPSPAGAVPTTGAPAAPTTQAAPAPAAPAAPAASISGFIEDASPGTPIANDQAALNALYQRFRDNVTFSGNATVASVSAVDYNVTNPNQSNVAFARSNQQTLTNQSPTVQIQANGDSIFIQVPYIGSQVYYFQSQVTLYGLVLKSTDVVGLYLSGDGSSLLKVQYNTKNPAIQSFQISTYGWYGSAIQLRVTSKPINTSGVYIPVAR